MAVLEHDHDSLGLLLARHDRAAEAGLGVLDHEVALGGDLGKLRRPPRREIEETVGGAHARDRNRAGVRSQYGTPGRRAGMVRPLRGGTWPNGEG